MIAMILSALAPGIALLTYFYLKDRYESEPVLLVLRMFLLGAIIGFPILIIQYGLVTEVSDHPLFTSYIAAGLLEEFFKWFVLYYLVYHHVEFDEPFDGIVYSVAVSLGFASLENFLYILGNGLSVAFLRALVPVSGHALFAVVMGYYLGKSKFWGGENRKGRLILQSLFLPVFLHGTYDFLIYASEAYWVFTMIPFMAWLWWYALKHVKKASRMSLASIVQNRRKKPVSPKPVKGEKEDLALVVTMEEGKS